MTTATTQHIRWVAGSDRVAHAQTRGPRTACGLHAIEERFAWPEQRRCSACMALVERNGMVR